MSKLYKYRKFDQYLLEDLTNCSVYYANPYDFNDPADCNITISEKFKIKDLEMCFEKLFSKLHEKSLNEKEISLQYSKKIDSIKYYTTEYGRYDDNGEGQSYFSTLLREEITQMLLDYIGLHGVFCLAKKWNCPLMWAHYGDYNRGLCLEYDFSKANNYSDEENPKKINYDSNRVIQIGELQQWLSENKDDLFLKIKNKYFFTKPRCWKYENEFRIIRKGSPGYGRSPAPLTSIIFGLRCPSSVKSAIINILSNSSDTEQFYEIDYDHNNQRISRLKLNKLDLTDFMMPKNYSRLLRPIKTIN